MLAGIAGFIRWVEELANLVSGPLLTLGLGIALVDLLTDGSLLARMPALLYTWAITQAIGVDAQLVAMWDKAHIALRERRYWSLFGLVVLGVVLAYVAWIAAQVFALQESEGLSEKAALSRLGMDSALWLIQRTALSVFLVCLAGWTRYHAPAPDVETDAEAERARLEADLLLEPLRAQKRIMQARGVRDVLAATMGRSTDLNTTVQGTGPASRDDAHAMPANRSDTMISTPQHTKKAPSRPPTGPGSPVSASKRRTTGATRSGSPRVVPLRGIVAEQRVRAVVVERPGISVRALARLAGVSESTASKWLTVIKSELAQAEQAVQ
jgi:hypothetical protein